MLINEILRDIRFRSFFLSGDLVCEFLVLFFKMSIAGWVSLTVSEGVSKFTAINTEPGLLELSETSDNFAYPIRSLNSLDKFLGLEILAVYEYRIENIDEGCVGIYLDFGCCGLSVIESDECLSVVEGAMQYLDGGIYLYKIEI
ncbi:hypothetical protein [Pseudomonas fontis]|uniref:Uncharacterized protein n=1 Tax=Pseudomonas fontis TaxID=2942633 RepID=A0ABT5P0Z3_9PSED|nr:hypothetical protein [Pseudomonas fontis]MDD0973152.1 hypothetical protein [Pseudomonas fontis]MDD0994075.1 hypothetical protein [Pseudomonas fontis]